MIGLDDANVRHALGLERCDGLVHQGNHRDRERCFAAALQALADDVARHQGLAPSSREHKHHPPVLLHASE